MRRWIAVVLGGLLSVGGLCANPMPIPYSYAGGVLVPARAVPVDVLHEWLAADITPTTVGKGHWYGAKVRAHYQLRADRAIEVPIVFPFTGPATAVSFTLGGRRLASRRLTLAQVLGPYEARWQRIIDTAVAADPQLAQAMAVARALLARARTMSDARHADEVRLAALGYAEEWLRQRTRRGMGAWLACALGAEGARRFPFAPTVGQPSDAERHLLGLRQLALCLDPSAPDPLALAAVPTDYFDSVAGFAATTLPLAAGVNALTVSFEQPLGRANYEPAAATSGTRDAIEVGGALPTFDYIVRTAAHWRSFDTLDVVVRLPANTKQVDCSEPNHKQSLGGAPPTVSWSLRGTPTRDVHLAFSDRAFGPSADEKAENEPVPAVLLKLRWAKLVGMDSRRSELGLGFDGERLLVADGTTAAVHDLRSGRVEHQFALPLNVTAAALSGDLAVVQFLGEAEQGLLRAFALDGREVWRMPPKQLGIGTVEVLEPAGDRLLVVGKNGFAALRLSDGGLVWRQAGERVTVVVGDRASTLCHATWQADGEVHVAALRLADGQPIWQWRRAAAEARLAWQPGLGLVGVVPDTSVGGPGSALAWDDQGRLRFDRRLEDLGERTETAAFACLSDRVVWAGDHQVQCCAVGPDGQVTAPRRAGIKSSQFARAALPDGRILLGGFSIECRDPQSAGALWRHEENFCTDLRVRGSLLLAWDHFPSILRVYELPPAGELPPRDEGRLARGKVPADLAGQLTRGAN